MTPQRSFTRSILLPEEGWLSLIFLAAVALSSVLSIQAAGWVEKLDVLTWVTLVAILCGFVLAKVRLPAALLHAVGSVLGVLVTVFVVAGTLAGGSLRANAVELWDRLEHWVNVMASGGISTDNLLFLLLLSVITWLTGYYGAFSVFRSRGPWWVILTSGSVLVVNLSYARTLDSYALFYLLSAMLLVMRLNVAVQEESWQRNGIQYTSDFVWQLVRSSMVVAVVIVFATWVVPGSTASQQLVEAWTKLSGPWQGAETEFSRLFGGLQAKDQINASGFGKALALKGATTLGDTAVLAVNGEAPRYLRGVVYDRYTGQGWLAPERSAEQMLPGDARLTTTGNLLLREEVTTTIKVLQPRGMSVLGPEQPLRVSLPVAAEYESSAQTGENVAPENAYVDISVMRSAVLLRRGQQYAVVSSVSQADAQSLRKASTDYPDWVKQRYLSVPPSIPNRVGTLARRITRGATTPYDRASAIQNFLRTYPYSSSVPPPPVGRDAVDFFLFEAKIGYCDYYASSMVVMLRSLGVPARVVSGYSPGDYDENLQAYLVRDANAHSWPEVYFPRYGWVEFEPTASRPTPLRPESSQLTTPEVPPDQIESVDNLDSSLSTLEETEHVIPPPFGQLPDGSFLATAGQFVAPFLAVAVAAYLILLFLWRRSFRGLAAGEVAYAKMLRLADWVGVGRSPHQTPFEHALRLAALVPEAGRDVQLIVDRFVRQRFGRKALAPGEEVVLGAAWRRLRGRLMGQIWSRLRRR